MSPWKTKMKIKISRLNKKAMTEHFDAIQEIDKVIPLEEGLRGWGREEFLLDLPEKWQRSLVATDESSCIVGFIIASRQDEAIHIHKIAISRGFQGKRVGTALIRTLCEKASSNGVATITIKVNKNNLLAIRFYQNFGFCRSEVKKTKHETLYIYKGKPDVILNILPM